jgi:hypothetical protein
VPFQKQTNNNHELGQKIISEASPPQCYRLSQPHRCHSSHFALIERPLLTSIAQKLRRSENGAFASRMRVYSRTLLCLKIVCCCCKQSLSWHMKYQIWQYVDLQQKFGTQEILPVTKGHRVTKELNLRPCRFQAVHQLQERDKAARIQCYHRFNCSVCELDHVQQWTVDAQENKPIQFHSIVFYSIALYFIIFYPILFRYDHFYVTFKWKLSLCLFPTDRRTKFIQVISN